MPTYTFLLFRRDDAAISLDAVGLDHDEATLAWSGKLLEDHLSCDYVEVWDGDRAVVARHREPPIIRPVSASAPPR
jgi:hypothetical protein